MEGGGWAIKPHTSLLSDMNSFYKFMQTVDNKQVIVKLGNLARDYPYYRNTHQDGNSFYRAFAYNWIRQSNLQNFEDVFPYYNAILLNMCKVNTIPSQFQKFYSEDSVRKSLKTAWQASIRNLAFVSQMERDDRLMELWNKYPWFDFIVVAYFRSLIYSTIAKNKEFYNKYASKSIQSELNSIITYSQYPSVLQYHAITYSVNCCLDICNLSRDNVTISKYDVEGCRKRQALILRGRHFDVLCPSNKPAEEKTHKVHFKLQHSDSISLSSKVSDKSFQTITSRVRTTKSAVPILKKSTKKWGSKCRTQNLQIPLAETSFLNADTTRNIIAFLLVLMVGILVLATTYKYSQQTYHLHRNEWSWHNDYISSELQRLQAYYQNQQPPNK